MKAYNSLLAAENAVRTANLWVKQEDGKMARRPVKLGLNDGTSVEIISGLQEGDAVVMGIGAPRRGARGGRRPGNGQRRPGGGRRPGAR